MLEAINTWLGHWEPTWLLIVLSLGLFYERETRNWTVKEFYYDKDKDDAKKQRRTKTTRKTTKGAGGESVTEEQIEVTEPIAEAKKNDDSQS
jgi:hypothetical protein